MKYPTLPTLAKRLKWARDRIKGMRQEDLGEMVGTTRHAIQKIEDGITQKPRNIEKLAKALKVSPAWLLFGIAELDDLTKEGVEIAIVWEKLPKELKKGLKHTMLAALPKPPTKNPQD